MRRQIRRVPTELPHARLYLDDLEEIERILRDSLSRQQTTTTKSSDAVHGEFRVIYETDDEQMDSIVDLQERGGSTKKLRMTVTDLSNSTRAYIRVSSDCSCDSYGLSQSERWALHGKLDDVFVRRKMHFKNFIHRLPQWAILGVIGIGALVDALYHLWAAKRPAVASGVDDLSWWILIPLFAVLFFTDFVVTPKVYFVRSNERSRARSEGKVKLSWLVVAAIVGGTITKLIDKIIAHVWK